MSQSATELRPVAARYAKALFDLAQEQNQTDTVVKELEQAVAAFSGQAALRRVAENPAISRAEQAKAVDAVLGAMKLSGLTRRFFSLLAQNRRLAALPLIAERFAFLSAESRNEATAEVTTAAPLTASQAKALKAALKSATGRSDVHIITREKPEILGGVIIKIDGKMFDNSIASKINRLTASLKAGTQTQ